MKKTRVEIWLKRLHIGFVLQLRANQVALRDLNAPVASPESKRSISAGILCAKRWRRTYDALENGPAAKADFFPYATRFGKRAFSLSRKISANLSKPGFDG